MGRTIKLTISLSEELISFADELAREKKVSRSKVFATCMEEMASKHREKEMAEGYKAMAQEQKRFAAVTSEIEHEILPEWR